MKCLLINLVFVIFVNSDTSKRLILPKLPAGEYRVNFLGMENCVQNRLNDKIQFNLYLSKKSRNTTEIKGNITTLTPLDDELTMEFNMAIKDSIGGWKDNAYVYKSPKACSTLKTLLGNAFIPLFDGLGVPNATCPIPLGVYKAHGMDTSLYAATHMPKLFFYGTYKFRIYYSKNNVIHGCLCIVMDIKRTWETD